MEGLTAIMHGLKPIQEINGKIRIETLHLNSYYDIITYISVTNPVTNHVKGLLLWRNIHSTHRISSGWLPC